MSKKWNQVGDWRIVTDNDAHRYIIPAALAPQFAQWIDHNEGTIDSYDGPKFEEFACNRHISQYQFTGVVKAVIVPPTAPPPKAGKA